MDLLDFNRHLFAYLDQSVTPFHAVRTATTWLREAGFKPLNLQEEWRLDPAQSYFVKRNESSLIAFRGAEFLDQGFCAVGAHTDSPCLKVKPHAATARLGYVRLGLEIYGGVLMNPWFDRDLALAGRVHFRDAEGRTRSELIDLRRAVLTIPSLAIHLDREANQKRSINPQTDLPALLSLDDRFGESEFNELLCNQLRKEAQVTVEKILSFELSLYDCQPAANIGLRNEFISSARLDNLVSCVVALRAILEAPLGRASLIVLNDHEEVGSQSSAGAQGPFLESVLQRLTPPGCHLSQIIERSLLVSADNAHGVHPNFPDRHDDKHGPILNRGPVVKINANQRYASSSETVALFKQAAEQAGVDLQVFVTRADMACGSTIGPITASRLGIRTVDVGVPQLAMHSIRELCGHEDPHRLYLVLKTLMAQADFATLYAQPDG